MQITNSKFIGNKAFYRTVLKVAIPIMIQNGITNFVNLLDNIMVGQIGTEPMSGVAIVNQLIFVYNLCIFGGLSGAGIFTAQYYGKGDHKGVRYTFRFKLWTGILLTLGCILLFLSSGTYLINCYLQGNAEEVSLALMHGKDYLYIMLLGLPGFMLVQCYSSTLRECGETLLPMKAGITAVFVNLILNYILIYGKFGAPALGVSGAAIATVIARYTEAIIVIGWTHLHGKKNPFILGAYRSIKVPRSLIKNILIKGTPLLVNESLWAMGMAFLAQCYSTRGLSIVAGLNISNTIANLFNIVFIALGSSVAIIIGQLLGAGNMKEAKKQDTWLITFSVLCSIGVAFVMFIFAPIFPKLYNTSIESRTYAKDFIMLSALFMPLAAFLHASYFTLRSGGKTFVTFLFDSVFICCVSVPIAFVLSRCTSLPVLWIYTCVQAADFIKCIIGYTLIKKGIWLNNIV